MKIAHYYYVDVDSKQIKETLKSIIKAHLLDCAVLMDRGGKSVVTNSVSGLTFEQQKELLILRLDHEKEVEQIKYQKKKCNWIWNCKNWL